MNHAWNMVLILEYGTPIVNQSKSLAYSLCSVSKYLGILYGCISVRQKNFACFIL